MPHSSITPGKLFLVGQSPTQATSAHRTNLTASGAKLISNGLTKTDIKLDNLIQGLEDFRREQRGWFLGLMESIESLNEALCDVETVMAQVCDDHPLSPHEPGN